MSVKVDNYKPWLVSTDKINLDFTRAIKDNETLKDGESLVFKVTHCNSRKGKDDLFYSAPFYTSPGGHKMCFVLFISEDIPSDDAYLSVYVKLLEGAFGIGLPYTFTGAVTFQLLNQLADGNHYIKTVECRDLKVTKIKGYSQFITHSQLTHDPTKNKQYLMNDTLYFRVTAKVKDHKPWLTCSHHT